MFCLAVSVLLALGVVLLGLIFLLLHVTLPFWFQSEVFIAGWQFEVQFGVMWLLALERHVQFFMY